MSRPRYKDRKPGEPSKRKSKLPQSPVQYGAKKTPQTVAIVLEALTKGLSPASAAEAAGVGRATIFNWRGDDPEFAKAWAEAVEHGVDKLEDEARRRAHDGVLRPVFQGGVEVGQVREFSDTLMTLMLRGRRPDRYNSERHEHVGNKDQPIQHRIEVEFVSAKSK